MPKEKISDIFTNVIPKVRIRVIDKADDTYLAKHKKKYPFKLDNHVIFKVITTKRGFQFRISQGYVWNGADIPKPLWWIGASKDNAYLIASMVHDFLLEYKFHIYNDILKNEMTLREYRRLTSLIFRELLKQHKTNTIKANIMAWCVDVFQITANHGKWKK